MSKHQGFPVPPVAMGLAAVAQRLAPKGKKVRRLRRVAAAVLVAAAGTLMAATFAAYTKKRTTVDPTAPTSTTALVTAGTNSLSRNPMYVAMAGVLLAHALDRGSWRALLPVAGFVATVERFQIVKEERALHGLFGQAYLDYCNSTPRWLGLGRSPSCQCRGLS